MKKMPTAVFAAALVGALATTATHQARAAADPQPAAAIETPDDVVIRAKRMKLYEMRMEMVEVEDRFFAKYNELNRNDDYDVFCSYIPRTGEIRGTRKCRPAFTEKVQSQYAADVALLSDPMREGPPFHIPATPNADVLGKWNEMKSNALRIVNSSPELRKMIRHREALEKSYQAEQKVRLNGRLYLLE